MTAVSFSRQQSWMISCFYKEQLCLMPLARWARVQGEPAQIPETSDVATKSQVIPRRRRSRMFLCRREGVESSVSNFSGDNNVAGLEQRLGGDVWIVL